MIVVRLIFMEATLKLPPLDNEIHPWSSQPGKHAAVYRHTDSSF